MNKLEIELEFKIKRLEVEPTVKEYLSVLHDILNYQGKRQQEFMNRSYQVRNKLRKEIK